MLLLLLYYIAFELTRDESSVMDRISDISGEVYIIPSYNPGNRYIALQSECVIRNYRAKLVPNYGLSKHSYKVKGRLLDISLSICPMGINTVLSNLSSQQPHQISLLL